MSRYTTRTPSIELIREGQNYEPKTGDVVFDLTARQNAVVNACTPDGVVLGLENGGQPVRPLTDLAYNPEATRTYGNGSRWQSEPVPGRVYYLTGLDENVIFGGFIGRDALMARCKPLADLGAPGTFEVTAGAFLNSYRFNPVAEYMFGNADLNNPALNGYISAIAHLKPEGGTFPIEPGPFCTSTACRPRILDSEAVGAMYVLPTGEVVMLKGKEPGRVNYAALVPGTAAEIVNQSIDTELWERGALYYASGSTALPRAWPKTPKAGEVYYATINGLAGEYQLLLPMDLFRGMVYLRLLDSGQGTECSPREFLSSARRNWELEWALENGRYIFQTETQLVHTVARRIDTLQVAIGQQAAEKATHGRKPIRPEFKYLVRSTPVDWHHRAGETAIDSRGREIPRIEPDGEMNNVPGGLVGGGLPLSSEQPPGELYGANAVRETLTNVYGDELKVPEGIHPVLAADLEDLTENGERLAERVASTPRIGPDDTTSRVLRGLPLGGFVVGADPSPDEQEPAVAVGCGATMAEPEANGSAEPPKVTVVMQGRFYRHIKSGRIYRVVDNSVRIEQGWEPAIGYRDLENGPLIIRPRSEFAADRFVLLTDAEVKELRPSQRWDRETDWFWSHWGDMELFFRAAATVDFIEPMDAVAVLRVIAGSASPGCTPIHVPGLNLNAEGLRPASLYYAVTMNRADSVAIHEDNDGLIKRALEIWEQAVLALCGPVESRPLFCGGKVEPLSVEDFKDRLLTDGYLKANARRPAVARKLRQWAAAHEFGQDSVSATAERFFPALKLVDLDKYYVGVQDVPRDRVNSAIGDTIGSVNSVAMRQGAAKQGISPDMPEEEIVALFVASNRKSESPDKPPVDQVWGMKEFNKFWDEHGAEMVKTALESQVKHKVPRPVETFGSGGTGGNISGNSGGGGGVEWVVPKFQDQHWDNLNEYSGREAESGIGEPVASETPPSEFEVPPGIMIARIGGGVPDEAVLTTLDGQTRTVAEWKAEAERRRDALSRDAGQDAYWIEAAPGELSDVIKSAMERRGLDVPEAAQRAGISVQELADIVHYDKSEWMPLKEIAKLAASLGCRVDIDFYDVPDLVAAHGYPAVADDSGTDESGDQEPQDDREELVQEIVSRVIQAQWDNASPPLEVSKQPADLFDEFTQRQAEAQWRAIKRVAETPVKSQPGGGLDTETAALAVQSRNSPDVEDGVGYMPLKVVAACEGVAVNWLYSVLPADMIYDRNGVENVNLHEFAGWVVRQASQSPGLFEDHAIIAARRALQAIPRELAEYYEHHAYDAESVAAIVRQLKKQGPPYILGPRPGAAARTRVTEDHATITYHLHNNVNCYEPDSLIKQIERANRADQGLIGWPEACMVLGLVSTE